MKGEHLFVACGLLAVVGGTFVHLAHATPSAHAVIAIDGSISVEPNCGGLRDTARSLLEKKPGIRDGSLLAVLVIGTDTLNINPKLAFMGPVPVPSDLVYGQDKEAFAKTQSQFFGQVATACQTAGGGRSSPIYELVRQGIANLRSEPMHCGPQGRCYLLAKTDLEEDVQPGLRRVLESGATNPDVTLPSDLRGSINNAGVEVTFCGISEGRARREKHAVSTPLETRMRIWKDVFTNTELVSFQPYCRG